MKYFVICFTALALTMGFVGCATQPEVKPDEEKLWSSANDRPEWTLKEPKPEGDMMFFIGVSDMYSTEKEARDGAMRSASISIVGYVGKFVSDQFEQGKTTYGLASNVFDPTIAAKQFQEGFSAEVTKQVKAEEWYIEKWSHKIKGIYFLAYVKASVPKPAIEDAFKSSVDNQLEAAKDRYAKESEEKAKEQYKNAVDMLEQMKSKGSGLK